MHMRRAHVQGQFRSGGRQTVKGRADVCAVALGGGVCRACAEPVQSCVQIHATQLCASHGSPPVLLAQGDSPATPRGLLYSCTCRFTAA